MSEDVFRWVVAVGVLLACLASVLQAVVLAGLYRAGKEAQKAGKEAQIKLAPMVDRFEGLLTTFNNFLTASGRLLEENRPRIGDITAETLVIVKNAREHVERIGELIDATNGQNAIRQAEVFTKSIGCTGVILTKLDGTAKGGVVIAVRQTINLPVKFIGVGEALDDLQPFDADTFVESLFA